MKKEIESPQDITLLVETFYSKLLRDPLVKHFFEGIAIADHLKDIARFWGFVLLNEPGYTTNVIHKHMHMPLQQEHFDCWLGHFNDTLDELFVGEKVKEAKLRAATIGWTMQNKIHQARFEQ